MLLASRFHSTVTFLKFRHWYKYLKSPCFTRLLFVKGIMLDIVGIGICYLYQVSSLFLCSWHAFGFHQFFGRDMNWQTCFMMFLSLFESHHLSIFHWKPFESLQASKHPSYMYLCIGYSERIFRSIMWHICLYSICTEMYSVQSVDGAIGTPKYAQYLSIPRPTATVVLSWLFDIYKRQNGRHHLKAIELSITTCSAVTPQFGWPGLCLNMLSFGQKA